MPAGQTYDSIATTTISSSTSSFAFTSISSSYTDLILVCANVTSSVGGATIYLRFNSDSGANYSNTEMYGNGTTTASPRNTGFTVIPIMYYVTTGTTQTGQITTAHIMNYSNATTYKTVLSRENNASDPNYPGTGASVGLWRSTSAINRIDVLNNGYNITGGTFTLYGIAAA